MIKIKLTPEPDNTFKIAHIVNNNVQVSSISGSELIEHVSSAITSKEELDQLRKLTKLFKARTITIDKH